MPLGALTGTSPGARPAGALTLDDLDRAPKVGERFHRALEREALTLRSRIELVRVDLAEAMSEPDPGRRALLMREAGVPIDGDAQEVDDDG